MPKYRVEIVRRYFVCDEVVVEADSPEMAEEKAGRISDDTDHTGRLQLEDVEATYVEEEEND